MSSYNHILVIANDDKLKKEISNHLINNSYACSLSNITTGIDSVKEKEPDLVFLSLSKDLSLLKELREISPSTPVILLVTWHEIELAKKALESGALDCILLPLESIDAIDRIIVRAKKHLSSIDDNRSYRHELEVVNAQLKKSFLTLREDQKAARKVQAKLLPQNKLEVDDYVLNYKIKTSLYLSGDFVDYFRVDEKHIVFYIIDVSGHGAASAFVTVLVKTLIQNLLKTEYCYHPDKVLQYLNKEIISLELQKHLTMLYFICDTENNSLKYSAAGHHPAPILFNGVSTESLKPEGFPVGAISNPHYHNHTHKLPEQFTLALFTDGILELMDGDLDSKEKELAEVCSLGKKTIVNFFDEKINTNQEINDDISLLLFCKG